MISTGVLGSIVLSQAGRKFVRLANCFGIFLRLPKTKGLAVGSALSETDASPVPLDGGEIEIVQEFTYLGSKLSSDGKSNLKLAVVLLRLINF